MKKEAEQRRKDNIADIMNIKVSQATDKAAFSQKEYEQKLLKASAELKEMESGLLNKNMLNINNDFVETKKETLRNLFRKEEQKKTPLLPDPIINLNYIIGYTAEYCPNVVYNSHGDYGTNPNPYKDNSVNPSKKIIYFCSGSNLVKFDSINIKQQFFLGHSKPISNYIIACKGEIIFSNQEGVNSIIRVWKTSNCQCIKMLTTPFDKLKVMTENKDSKYLCTVGNELNRVSIIIWNIENLENITAFIRQAIPNHINTIKFSPFEENILYSCGKENIKCWRIKKDHLSGKAIVLNQFARGNDFLCLDYNNTMFGEDFTNKGKVYVGSNGGCIFQISCTNQELEAVYKVQDSAILALAVNEAFCATGSKDGYLRIWPVDFSEFLIEAKHDTGVCAVDISYDAMDILCGTLGGSIGILNVQNKEYKTILRSPPNIVKQLILHPSGDYLFSIEGDNSVRIWDIENKAEAFQFVSSKDPPICVAAPKELLFACGFSSGILKIFDLEKTEVLYECKPFKSALNNLLYIQNDKLLVTMSAQGNLSIHDCSNNYIQIKIINIDTPTVYTDISLAVEADYFSTIGSESNCALVWNCLTFGMKNRVPINNFFIKKICLINKNLLACILDNCNVRFYALSAYEGVFIKELMNLHINNVNHFITSHNYRYLLSSGEEGMIKIWDMKMVFKTMQSYQQFIGHATGVRGLILMESKGLLISASEKSGIYFWNFLGDTTFTESEIVQEIEKLNVPSHLKMLNEKSTMIEQTIGGGKSINLKNAKTAGKSEKKPLLTKDIRAQHMENEYKAENDFEKTNPNYEIITKGIKENDPNDTNKDKLYELKVLSVGKEDNDDINISYTNTDFNIDQEVLDRFDTSNIPPDDPKNQEINHKLLFKGKYLPDKSVNFVEPEINSNILNCKYCLGLSINSMNNLVFNKRDKWYAYTINNKVVVEFLENERREIILSDSKDELSCLILAPNGKYLVSTVGCTNREEYAPIIIYETNNLNFVLKKKLNFHFKGVQHIAISPDCKYMISIGTLEEKSICVWNFTNLTVIDSKSLKFNIFSVVCENRDDLNLYFMTASQHVISFWKINENYKLDGFHMNFEDLTNQRVVGEYITGLTLTPYFTNIKTCYAILSTNKGNVLIVDKERKSMFKKFIISKFPLTKLFFVEEHFICAGEGPLLYCWKFEKEKLESKNIFSFLEKEKATLLFLDSAVNSMVLSESGEEGLLTTDIGSIFFMNFEERAAFKIISAHINCKINSLDCDISNQNLISSGEDGGIRCWTLDSFDQRFLLQKIGKTPKKILLNPKENILIIQYENDYLSLYNMTTLKSLGKISIPDEQILYYDLIFDNDAILLITVEKNIYLVNINGWEPLSMSFTELALRNNTILPKNQICKSLNCKSISNEKGYTTLSFADGTIVTFYLEKNNNQVNFTLLDKYNMLEVYLQNNEDKNIKEIYNNLTNYRNDFKAISLFSNHFDGVVLGFHECLQFLFVRNYVKRDIIKLIPLNYFPSSLALSDQEKYIAVGTKEGLLLFITRGEENYNSCFNLDIFKGHYDTVDSIKFSHDTKKVFSTSKNELFVWDINSK
jgi:WD40 repeat protein